MKPVILRPNATAVYRFLSAINSRLPAEDSLLGKRILDCGGGGPVPPVAIFAEQGMEAHAIDISEAYLAKSRAFCEQTGIRIELRLGDMRALAYDDGTFDYVYEHYSICHLSPFDTAAALAEMRRVLKPGGLARIGVISTDSWPLSSYGKEASPGEYRSTEGGEEVSHSVFSDRQADALVSDWEVLRKEKGVRILRAQGEETSEDAWRSLYPEARDPCSEAEWMARYPDRANCFTYVHAFYDLRKPAA